MSEKRNETAPMPCEDPCRLAIQQTLHGAIVESRFIVHLAGPEFDLAKDVSPPC